MSGGHLYERVDDGHLARRPADKIAAWINSVNMDSEPEYDLPRQSSRTRRRVEKSRAGNRALHNRYMSPSDASAMNLRGMADVSVEEASPQIGVSSPKLDASSPNADTVERDARPKGMKKSSQTDLARAYRNPMASTQRQSDGSQMRHTRRQVPEPRLSTMMHRVMAQFSYPIVDDHQCAGRVQCICMSSSVRQQSVLGSPSPQLRAAYGLFLGQGDKSNFAAALSQCEYAPGFLQRRRPPSAVTLLRRAELWGTLSALSYAINVLPPLSCAHVCIDSTYIAKAWSVWIPQWESNGWPSEGDPGSRTSLATNRRLPDADSASAFSATDDSISGSSTSTKRSRRLINEDLLRELARLHHRCAELELRGDICVHLYLIDRAHNPAEQMARGLAEQELPNLPNSQPALDALQRKHEPRPAVRAADLDALEVSFEADMYEPPDPARKLRSHASEPSLRKRDNDSPLGVRRDRPEHVRLAPPVTTARTPSPLRSTSALRASSPLRPESPTLEALQRRVTSSPTAPRLTEESLRKMDQESEPLGHLRRPLSRNSARSEGGSSIIERLLPRFMRRKKKDSDDAKVAPPLPSLGVTAATAVSPQAPVSPAFESPAAVVASPNTQNAEAGLFSPGVSSPKPVAAPALSAELYTSAGLPMLGKHMSPEAQPSGLGIMVNNDEPPPRPSSHFQSNRRMRPSTSQPNLRPRRAVPPVRSPVIGADEDEASLMSSQLRATAKAVARAEQGTAGGSHLRQSKRGALLEMVEDVPSSVRTYTTHPRPSGRRSWKMRTLADGDSSEEERGAHPREANLPLTPSRPRNVHANAMQISPYSISDSEDAVFARRYNHR